MPLDHTRTGTHSHKITDPYPRFIRETMVDGGEPETRVIKFPQEPHNYAVTTPLHFDGLELIMFAEITRDEYDEAITASEVVDIIKSQWTERLIDLHFWIKDEILE